MTRVGAVADDDPVNEYDGPWLGDDELDEIRALGARRTLPAGGVLFMEGDEPYDVILVGTGDVKLVTTAANGQELVLEVLGPGDVIGELSAVDGSARSATAVAMTTVEVTTVPADRFMEHLESNPSMLGALLRVTVLRLRQANLRQLEFSSSDALGRVCRRLDEIAGRKDLDAGDCVTIDIGLTQTELAQWCGLSREAVVKALRKLRTLGWISQADGLVTLNDRGQLRARGEF